MRLEENSELLKSEQQKDAVGHARRRRKLMATDEGRASLAAVNKTFQAHHRTDLAATDEGRAKLNVTREKNTTAHAAHRHEEKEKYLPALTALMLQDEADSPEIKAAILDEIEARYRQVQEDFVHTHVCLVCDGTYRRRDMYLRKLGDISERVKQNMKV